MPTRQQANEEVAAAVRGFIARGETFTSAHVTMVVRGNQQWAGTLGHERGVAPIVRSMYSRGEMQGYSQTMRGSFFAYHPVGQDPSSVDLRIGGSNWLPRVDRAAFSDADDSNAAPASTSAPGATTNRGGVPLAKDVYNGGGTASDGDVVRVEYNAQGHAQLPKPMTNAIGLEPGDEVVLEGQQLGNEVTLRKANDGETAMARLQPSSGALRIRDRVLMPYGVGLHDDVTVRLDLTAQTLTLT